MAALMCASVILCALFSTTSSVLAADLMPVIRNGFCIALPQEWRVINELPLEQNGGSILILAEELSGGLKLSAVAAPNGTLLQDAFGEMDSTAVAAMCGDFGQAMARLGNLESCARLESREAFALRLVFSVPAQSPPMKNYMLFFPDNPENMVISALFPAEQSTHYLPILDSVMNGVTLPPASR